MRSSLLTWTERGLLALLLGCGGDAPSGALAPDTAQDSPDPIDTADTGSGADGACETLFAAMLANAMELSDCEQPLTADYLDCTTADTPNGCGERLWADPSIGDDPGGHQRLVWAPQCADGGDGCAPGDTDAVSCVDGTRPYYYVQPGVTEDGSPSRRWMFRWHNGQVTDADVAGGCSFEGSCSDALGSQGGGGVDQSRSSSGLFTDEHDTWLSAYNRVYFVDPCITDYYGGDRAAEGEHTEGGRTYSFPYQFRGQNFLEGVFRQLADDPETTGMPAMDEAELVILYAWSGGGRHIIQNIDWLAWDADDDSVQDGGLLGGISPGATVRGVVSSRVQPELAVHALFVEVDAQQARWDTDGQATGAFASVAEAEALGTVYDVPISHGAQADLPLPTHSGACPDEAPLYPPFTSASCWEDGPVLTNAAFRDGLIAEMLDGWGYRRDASCLAAHSDAPQTCNDFQHVLLNHVVSDVFVYAALHDQAYRSPQKLPTYAGDEDYYWSPGQMRSRVQKQLADFARYRWTDSALATGADPSCAGGGCVDRGAAVFAPDLYLHDDPVNSAESGFQVHLCGEDGAARSLSDALQAWAERGEAAADLVLIEGVDGVSACEAGGDEDGDGLSGCDDPDWRYRLAEGSDTTLLCGD